MKSDNVIFLKLVINLNFNINSNMKGANQDKKGNPLD